MLIYSYINTALSQSELSGLYVNFYYMSLYTSKALSVVKVSVFGGIEISFPAIILSFSFSQSIENPSPVK